MERTIKEIEKEITDLREQFVKDRVKVESEYNTARERLEKELETIKANFEKWIRKQFGRLKIEITINNEGILINTKSGILLYYRYNYLSAGSIEQDLVEEIKSRYIAIYGYPQEKTREINSPIDRISY